MKRHLIITADDFGFSKERNQGVVKVFKNSAVKSASLLLNCTGTLEAAEFFKTQNLCPGLHLNLTEGHPLSQKQHSTLTNPEGKFLGKFGLRKRLEEGEIDLLEVRHEIKCQIAEFVKLVGKKPSYVDGHQHIHVHPAVADIFASTLHDNSIQVTRLPVEISMERKEWVKAGVRQFYVEVMDDAEKCKTVFDSYGVRYSDTFVGLSTMGADMTVARLQSSILESFQDAEKSHRNKLKPYVICELMTHPGYATDKHGGGFDGQSDEFGCSQDREHEIGVLSSKQMFDFYEENNIQSVSHEIFSEGLNN